MTDQDFLFVKEKFQDKLHPNLKKKELKLFWEDGIWVDKEGTLVYLDLITDNRLESITNFLVKQAAAAASRIAKFYVYCPEPQGDMAQLAFDREFDFWTSGGDEYSEAWQMILATHPIFPALVEELEKRPALQGLLMKIKPLDLDDLE